MEAAEGMPRWLVEAVMAADPSALGWMAAAYLAGVETGRQLPRTVVDCHCADVSTADQRPGTQWTPGCAVHPTGREA